MHASKKAVVAAGLLVVAGLVIVLVDTDAHQGYSIGNVEPGAAYSSELSVAFDGAWLVSRQALVGYALIWLGTLLAAGALGSRRAVRRAAPS